MVGRKKNIIMQTLESRSFAYSPSFKEIPPSHGIPSNVFAESMAGDDGSLAWNDCPVMFVRSK
jgi:hypothetical protein